MLRRDLHASSCRIDPAVLTCLGIGTLATSIPAAAQIRFAPHQRAAVPGRDATSIALADLSGNGLTDAAISTQVEYLGAGRLFTCIQIDRGTTENHFILQRPGPLIGLICADMDADGHTDVVWREDDRVGVWYNSGEGRLGSLHLEPMGAFVKRLEVGDVDGDGAPDLLAILGDFSTPPHRVEARLARGRGAFESRPVYEHPNAEFAAQDLTLGDVDGDGDVDIALLCARMYFIYTYESEVVYLTNDASGRFSESNRWPLPWGNGVEQFPQAVRAGDLDGDGDLDFLVATGEHYPRTRVFAFRNDGDRLAQTASLGSAYESRIRVLTVADLDLDGRLDAVFAARSELFVTRNLGDARFAPAQSIDTGRGAVASAALADIAGTGQWDIAALVGSRHLALVRNISVRPGPHLDVGPLTRGEPVALAVREALPGETVHFLYSLDGVGHERGQPLLGGMVLDLRNPVIQFGSAVADQDGTAVLGRIVPQGAPLTNIAFQAVIRRGSGGEDSVKSTFRTVRVEPN